MIFSIFNFSGIIELPDFFFLIILSYFAISIYLNNEILLVDSLLLVKRSHSDMEGSPVLTSDKRIRIENWNHAVQSEPAKADPQLDEQMQIQFELETSFDKLNSQDMSSQDKIELINEIVNKIALYHELQGDIQDLGVFSLIEREADFLTIKSQVSDKVNVELEEKDLFDESSSEEPTQEKDNSKSKHNSTGSSNGEGPSSPNVGGEPSNSTSNSGSSNFSILEEITFWLLLTLNKLIELITGYNDLF